MRLLPMENISTPKNVSHTKIRENFENFFKKLEERLSNLKIQIKFTINYSKKVINMILYKLYLFLMIYFFLLS